MNTEALIEAFLCPLSGKHSSNSKHLLNSPRVFPCCKQTACQKCIIKHSRQESASKSNSIYDSFKFLCPFCRQIFRFNLNLNTLGTDLESNERVLSELDSNVIELNHYLVKKFDVCIKNVDERLASKEKSIDKRKEFIKQEIRSQVEVLKHHLDSLELEMLSSLDKSCLNVQSSLIKLEQAYRSDLDEKRKQIQDLKENAFSYAYGIKMDESKASQKHALNTIPQYNSIEKCMHGINQIEKINNSISELVDELRFDQNIDLPTKSLIGKLRKVKDVNMVEMFENIRLESQINKVYSLSSSPSQLMSILPRYLCIADANNLFFTDSQTKQLINLKLDTGDLIRATNLEGLIKNPDGICVNAKTGHIYLGDNEQKLIFKLDANLNVLKKISSKDIRWPRGMCYDSEADSDLNCLYVCDYSNQRIAILNANDQLRDFVCIPPTSGYSHDIKPKEKRDDSHKKYEKQLIFDEDAKFCPLNIVVKNSLMYVTDDWTGGNCIRIFDKKTHALLKNVGHLNVWSPLSLIVDDFGNIFTIGRLNYETGDSHLFAFDKDGQLLYKCNLNIGSDLVTDMALDKYTDKSNLKLFCAGEKRIYIFDV